MEIGRRNDSEKRGFAIRGRTVATDGTPAIAGGLMIDHWVGAVIDGGIRRPSATNRFVPEWSLGRSP